MPTSDASSASAAEQLEHLAKTFSASLSSVTKAVDAFVAENPGLSKSLNLDAVGKARDAVQGRIDEFRKAFADAPEKAGKEAHGYLERVKQAVDASVKTLSERAEAWGKELQINDKDVSEGQKIVAAAKKAAEDVKKAAASWYEAASKYFAEYVQRSLEEGTKDDAPQFY